MSKLDIPEADFFEILQSRIELLQATRAYGNSTSDVISELTNIQQNFNNYLYKLKHKTQAD